MKVFLICVGAFFGLVLLDWFIEGNNLLLYRYFAPKKEAARREVYEQTKSYRQGSVQRLATLCQQVVADDGTHGQMLNSVIAQEFAEWDAEAVPAYLRGCLSIARR